MVKKNKGFTWSVKFQDSRVNTLVEDTGNVSKHDTLVI